MINKYNSVNVTSTLRIVSLLLVFMLAPLSNISFTHATTRSWVSENVSDPIINPGLDPMVALSSNSASLSSSVNSTDEVNVTSNITWTATVSPFVSWLTVSPGSATGNGKLTFTAVEANTSKVSPRTAYVVIRATGVADQTIVVTQSQEVPAVTFSSSNSGNLSINLQFNLGGTFFIDWGDGNQIAYPATTLGQDYKTKTYTKDAVVRVYGSGITNLTANSSELTSLVVSESKSLTYLSLSHNNLTTLDIHKNTNLTFLDCSYNNLNSLDLSQNTQLSSLSLGYNNLTTIDLSQNTSLLTLNCISNKLTSLNLHNNASLTSLYCYSNGLSSLDLSSNPAIKVLYCYSNNFNFTTLPLDRGTFTSYRTAPQPNLAANVIGNVVNINSQLSATDKYGNPQTTVYKWFTKTGTPLSLGTDYNEASGVFTFLVTPSDSVYCAMTNAAFPDFNSTPLRTVNMKVVLKLPAVTTLAVSNKSGIAATGNGNITDLGIPNPTQYGVVWSTSTGPTVALSTKTTQGAISNTGAFTSSMTGLAPGTTYYVRAYATNIVGTAYGAETSFTTTGILPTVTTEAVTGVGIISVTGNGTITNLGAPNPTQYGVVWGTTSNPTIALLTKTTQGGVSSPGAFTSAITGLSPNTTYHVRAYATNSQGTSYGLDVPFTTPGPGITTPSPISLSGFSTLVGAASTSKTFTVGGMLLSDLVVIAPSGYEVRESGVGSFGASVSFTPSSGTVANKTIEVRIAASAPIGTVTGNVVCSSTGVASQNVAVDGIVLKRQLTITDPTVTPGKVYDGNTMANVTAGTLSGVFTGDDVTLTASASYDNANAGTGKTITVTYALAGTSASKYLKPADFTTLGDITKATVNVISASTTKTYDGTAVSAGIPTVGALATGDVVNATPIQVYDNANVGSTHILIPSGLTIKNGINADVTNNYTINYVNSPATGVISKLALTVTAVSALKIYDGNTASRGIPTVGALAAGDVVNAAPIEVYDNSLVGTNHVLTPSGLTVKNGSNVDVTGNYTISYVNSSATGVINSLALTVTAIPDTKVYDGKVSSGGIPSVGTLASGDVVNIAPKQVFDNATVGTAHVLTPSGLTIKNSNNIDVTSSYTISYVNSAPTGVITKAGVIVTAVTNTKTYDGNTNSAGVPTVGTLITGDVVNAIPVQIFDNADVGTTHILTPSGLTIKNALNADVTNNYMISYVSSPSTGVINKKTVNVTAVSATKIYDGSTGSTGMPNVGALVTGDVVNATPIQVYDSPIVGTAHILTPSGLTIKNGSNVDVTNNYTINYVNSPSTGVINKLAVTVTAVPDTKAYDGNVSSTAIPTIVTLAAGDVVNVAPKQVYDNASVGTTHVLTPSGLTIKNGSNVDVTTNYTISYVNSTPTGVITNAGVIVTAVPDTKTYDGNINSVGVPTVGSLLAGDAVSVAPKQVYDNASVGTTHILTPSGLTIKNSSNVDVTSNYTIIYVSSPSTGIINKKTVNVTGVPATKTYNGTTVSAGIPTVGSLASGDVVNTTPIQVYDNANVGTTHILTPSGLTIKNGINADVTTNYTINYVNSPATGVINKLTVAVTGVPDIKVYDGTTTSSGIPTVGALAAGDVVNAAPIQVYDNSLVGTNHVLTPSGLTVKNNSNVDVTGNYTISYVPSLATGVINKLAVTVTAIPDTKVYDGKVISAGIPTVGTLASGDVVNITPKQVFDNASVGTAHILTPSGLTIKNSNNVDVTSSYTISYVNSTPTGVITKANVIVTGVTDTKNYDGNTNSAGVPTVGTLITGDVVNAIPVQIFDNADVGITHVLTPSGLTIKNGLNADVTNNYTISYVSSPSTGVINKKTVNVTAVSATKIYDGTTGSTGIPNVGALVTGDVVNATPIQVYDSPIVGTAHILTPSGLTIKNGVNADVTTNYTINYVNSPATGVINKLAVTVTAVPDTKAYDGNVSSTAIPTIVTLASGDVVNVAPKQVYDNASVGTTHVLTPSGLTIKNGSNVDVTTNYTINYVNSTATGVITNAGVIVTAVPDTKTYDGNTSSTGVPTVGLLLAGDAVSVAPKQVYDNASVGTSHVLTPSGLTIKNSSNVDVTSNYTIIYVSSPSTGIINKKTVNVTGVPATKTYNGTTVSAGIPTVGSLASGDVVNTTPIQVYDNANVGTTHILTPSGLTIKNGINADVTTNYTINYVNSPATGVINKLNLTVTAIASAKVYDGNVSSTGSPTIATLAAGDVVNAAPIQVYDNSLVGTNHVLTPSGLTVKNGSNADVTGNYTISYVNSPATGVINKLGVTVTAVATTKVYDGNLSSTGTPLIVTLAAGDAVNTAPIQVYDNATVGTVHILTPSGLTIKNSSNADVTDNYTINYVNSQPSGVITKADVTVIAVTDSKTYDGNTLSTGVPTVGTLVTGDVVSTAPIQAFDNANVGTAHALIPSGLIIKNGVNADVTNNYTINYLNSPSTGIITKADVTVTAVADTKTYDGSTGSVGLPLVGALVTGDVVNAAPIQVFDNATVGTAHVLTPSGLTIKNGVNADVTNNYTINYVNSPATGIINKLTVTVTAISDTKVYDGGVGSTGTPMIVTLAAGDVVNVAPIQVYDNATVGTTHILTPSGLTIKNGSNVDVTNNYTISYVNSQPNGVIGKADVTVTAVTDTKAYDGNTNSSGTPVVGTLVAGDAVNVAPTQVFDNSNAGTDHKLIASGLTIKNPLNADVTNNYTINYVSSPATGVITKFGVTVTAATDTKTYDGNTSSVGNPAVGPLAIGDVVNAIPTQAFDNANAGVAHILTPSGLTIKNAANADVTTNYIISYVNSPATGIINKLALTVTAVAATKVYDANITSAGIPTVGVLATGDVVNAGPVQVYDNTTVGSTHILTPSGLTLKNGSNADVTGNYTISYVNSPATGVINKLGVTVTAVATTKVYDGNLSSTGTPLIVTLAAGDAVNAAPIQVYDNATVGTVHILTPSGLTIKNSSNADVTDNYTINYVNSQPSGVITKADVTVIAVTDSKTYDGNTLSAGAPTVGTLVTGDVVSTAPIQAFDNANVGTAHALIPSGLTIKNGVNADVTNNYTINYLNSPSTGIITKADVTVTAVADTKTYDGSTGSAGLPLVGALVTGDVVNAAPIQVFDNATVGTAHVLTPSGLTIKNGVNADVTNNYTINYVNSPAIGVINKLGVTVTAVADTKIYDGDVSSTGKPTIMTLATGDVVNLAPIQVYDNATVGTAHVLTPSGLKIKNAANADVTNDYTISYVNSSATGVITPKKLTVTDPTITTFKVYDGNSAASVIHGTMTGVETGDDVTLNAVAAYDNSAVGKGKTITVTYSLSGSAAVNYTAPSIYTVTNGEIAGKPLTASNPVITTTKSYDGNTSASVVPGTLTGIETGDDVSLKATAAYDNATVGTNKTITVVYELQGLSAGNYTAPANYTVTNGEITGKLLTASNPTITTIKTYDGTTTAVVTPGSLSGIEPGDNVILNATATYDNTAAGKGKTITVTYSLSGSSANNYMAPASYSISTGEITTKPLTVSDPQVVINKVYDGTTTVDITPGVISGTEPGDEIQIVATAVYDNVNVGKGKTITVTYTLTGSSATNYTAPAGFTITTGEIVGKPLTLTDPTVTTRKVYDGNVTADVIQGVLSGFDPADNITLSATATYDNANVGTGKTITVKYGLTGAAAATYAVPSDYVIHTGEIAGKQLTVTDPVITTYKVYDGTTSAVVTPGVLSGILGTDNVSLKATATYDNATVGTGKTMICSYQLAGNAAGNYLAPSDFIETGSIGGKPLVVVSIKLNTSKVYDATTVAAFTVGDLTGVEAIDAGNVILSGSAMYDNANVGTGKTITVTYNLSGSAAVNYSTPATYTITNGEIVVKPLTVTDPTVVLDKMYDGNTTAAITAIGSLQGVEAADINNIGLTALADYNSKDIADNKTITVVYTLSGSAKDNYLVPADFKITGAKISDNVTLSPMVTSTTGCEGSSLDLAYTILTGTPTQYKITFGTSALAAGIQNISYTNLPTTDVNGMLPITVPKGTPDGVYQGTLQMRNELGMESPVYNFQFTINVSSDFIIPKFDDVVLCDNSSNHFTAYQWYKDGVLIDGATQQFYCDPDGLIGSYSLKVSTTDGQTLFTCAKVLNVPLTKKVSAFPSPVKINQTCTVKLTGLNSEDLDGAELSVYTMQGVCVSHTTKVLKQNVINLPPVVGIYLGHVTTSKGQDFPFKVIVVE